MSQLKRLIFLSSMPVRLRSAAFMLMATALLSGCAVIAVVDTAASLAIGTVGLVGDAAIGTVRLTGKAVGAAADVLLPSSPAP